MEPVLELVLTHNKRLSTLGIRIESQESIRSFRELIKGRRSSW
jgi:hypothetical protein